MQITQFLTFLCRLFFQHPIYTYIKEMDTFNKQEFSFIYIHPNRIEKTILKQAF